MPWPFSSKKPKKPPTRKVTRQQQGADIELESFKPKVTFAPGVKTTESEHVLPKDAPLRPIAKTRRTVPAVTHDMSDDDRYAYNKKSTEDALGTIYDAFYAKTGDRLDLNGRINKVYGMMGKGVSEYMKNPVAHDTFTAFNVTNKAVRVKGQKVSAYEKALKAYNDWPTADPATRPATRPKKPTGPKTNDESVLNGDYFHVHNLRPDLTKDLKGKSRRIIVNVKSQEAGLRVAKAVQDLFTDPDAGPGIREYKIYLSEKGENVTTAKYDKLVIYYAMKDDLDGADVRGDKIVSAISGAIKPTDVDQGFAPFYSILGPGVAWAEEPKHFVEALQESFTTTRSNIISGVIKSKDKVVDKAEFIRLVNDALKTAGVDPERPHRHLVGAKT
ncbi:T3SS effector HopA1 family protein [Nonomuraea sp. NPDC050556]|uniref:T3SS effector HopA1 family protein n=1 Tax=Nonomuraea sp. NPDC050556 TaxID=3364369 RepID=UPI003798034F